MNEKPKVQYIVRILNTDLNGKLPIGHSLLKIKGIKFIFSNAIFKREYNIINIGILQKLDYIEDGTTVDKELLLSNKALHKKRLPFKVLGKGKLTKSITVKANAFSKKAIEKVAATAQQIPEDNPKIKEIKRQLLINIEMILKKFVGNYLVILIIPENSLHRASNAKLYFHECIHVLLNENGFYFRSKYNEGLVTYFQAKYIVGGRREMKTKIKIFSEMEDGQNPNYYYSYALKWHNFFEKNPSMSKHDVVKMVHQQHG